MRNCLKSNNNIVLFSVDDFASKDPVNKISSPSHHVSGTNVIKILQIKELSQPKNQAMGIITNRMCGRETAGEKLTLYLI